MAKLSHPHRTPVLLSAHGFNEPFYFPLFDLPLSYFAAIPFRARYIISVVFITLLYEFIYRRLYLELIPVLRGCGPPPLRCISGAEHLCLSRRLPPAPVPDRLS